MDNPFYNRLGSVLWVALVILVVTLAAYVSVGRLLTANLAHYRVEILQALNERLPFGIEAQQVSGEWQSFTPALVLTGLRISIPGSDSPPLELSRGRMAVDVLNSLRTQSLQMSSLVLDDLLLRGELSREGRFRLSGFGQGESQAAAPLREFILNVERISLRHNRLVLALPGGEVRDLDLDLELSRDGSERHVQATLASSAGARFSVVAQGLGNPFTPHLFSGQLYLDMQSTDLGAIRGVLADGTPGVWTDGTADLELWFNWDRGTASVEARLESADLLIAATDDSWQLPLQRLALQARLLRREQGWTLFLADLQLAQGGVEWALPRAQLETLGNTLRLRTGGFALAPLNTIVTEQAAVPDALREVFAALQLRGRVSALQLDLDNTAQPADHWQVAANFERVDVDSLHGAPGVTGANGYARIGRGGGFVILDGQAMSLDFPSIYSEPLQFEDLYGTVNLDWDAGAVRLASGLLTTRGQEGVAKVLFGLNIPLQADDYGIEMDLLVGLHDTHPVHRAKYIPYILDPTLLSWLADSIGDGDIQQGAFLWRGSLRAGAAPLRTVQLAFNVTDTQLRYHPQWPPVSVEQGVVLIDDSDVSVWAERASLYQSRVDELSVETRVTATGDITLDLRGAIHGPVSDGFRVLNESPLAQVVGPTFAAWTASGNLDTQLQLWMNLSDTSVAPRVDVATRWRDVELLVSPGNLPLQSLNGEFEYSTESGFRSSELAATLWGNPVTASLRQHHSVGDGGYDPATTVVDVELATRVELADVRRWLQLDSLSFASGQAAADMSIRLAPGVPPVLTVSSDLQGVSLALPEPWLKPAQEPLLLSLAMPLAAGVTPLSVELGEQLRMHLDIEDGVVRAGALGINAPAPAVEDGVLRITGSAPLIQADEWLALAEMYFGEPERDSPGTADAAAPAVGNEAAAAGALKLAVDELSAERVVILGRELRDVGFTLSLEDAHWEATLVSQWLRGQASRTGEDSPVQVAVDYLDLDRVPDVELPQGGADPAAPTRAMPPLDISLRNLFQSGQRLGELQFTLHQTADAMTLEDVSGELALLRLPPARPAQLVWHRGAGGYTELQARLAFEDIGQTLGFFDYQRIVETEGGEFDVTLRWPGSPQQFSLEAAQGELVARIGSGSFLEAPASASGALRVVSILNLADIVQRLSLSNMFEAGIPFDSVQGEIEVRDGLLTVSRMDVEGGSSFRFSGVSDLRTQSLDGQLVATLPVANNLPWIAALAASLPVAAGVFVVSQVFNKQMNRLSSAVYSIGGDWNDPEVTFDRMFDNTPRTGSAAADRTAGEEAAVAPALDSGVQEASPQDGEAGQGAQSGSP